jgi:hypothetical protein
MFCRPAVGHHHYPLPPTTPAVAVAGVEDLQEKTREDRPFDCVATESTSALRLCVLIFEHVEVGNYSAFLGTYTQRFGFKKEF